MLDTQEYLKQYQLQPVLEYIQQLQPDDTQAIYEFGVRLSDIIQQKYIKHGKAIKSVDELFDITDKICQIIHLHAQSYVKCVESIRPLLIKRSSSIEKIIDDEDLLALDEMRWMTFCKLLLDDKQKKHLQQVM